MSRLDRVPRRGWLGVLFVVALLPACGPSEDPAVAQRLAEGRQVFTEKAQPLCVTCHTLRDAGASGKVGPDLDLLAPDSARVAAAVTNGVGIMPAQGDNLTAAEIGAVAAYVAAVAGAERN